MPLNGVGSYPPVMHEFVNYWTAVNANLGASALTLRGGYTLAQFTADRAAIVAAQNGVIDQDNAVQTTDGSMGFL